MIARGDFLEYAEVFGNYYGTAKKVLDDAIMRDQTLLLDIDVQGASLLHTVLPEAVSIFVLPPNRQELENRLRRRSSIDQMNEENIRCRLETAAKEVARYDEYAYVVVNDRLDDTVDLLKSIIVTERRRHAGIEPTCAADHAMACLAESRKLENVKASLAPILDSFRNI
jgi:guanylate kinase